MQCVSFPPKLPSPLFTLHPWKGIQSLPPLLRCIGWKTWLRIFNISLQETYLHWPVSTLEFLQPPQTENQFNHWVRTYDALLRNNLCCCDRKSRAAYAQSFALWQQGTIVFTSHDHSIIAYDAHLHPTFLIDRFKCLWLFINLHFSSIIQRSSTMETKCSGCPWIASVFACQKYCFCVVKNMWTMCTHQAEKRKKCWGSILLFSRLDMC